MTPVILACGHVETRPGKCATTDCINYDRPRWAMYGSMLAIAALLLYVRLLTGRGAINIILDHLPPVVGT